MTSMDLDTRTSGIQVLDRAASLLRLLADADRPLRVQELAEQSHLVASTTRRILLSLCENGLCEQVDGAYRLGIRLFELGSRVEAGLDLRSVSRGPLQCLSAATRLTTCLWVRYDDRAVVIDRFDGDYAFSGAPTVGTTQGLNEDAAPRVFLAWGTDHEIQTYWRRHRRLGDVTEDVRAALAEARELGYALTAKETSGVRQLAMPLFGYGEGNRPVAAISVAGLEPHFVDAGIESLVHDLREAADAISRGLGHGLGRAEQLRTPVSA
jgi:DNA-binding IclR family transcriptional regulator